MARPTRPFSILTVPLVALQVALAPPTFAATPACDALPPPGSARATALLDTLHVHDCCDDVLSACLAAVPRCAVAERMAENVCRRVARGDDDASIRHAVQLRAWNALPLPVTPTFDLQDAPTVGDPAAPVEVVVYAAPRGVHCARLVPGVFDAITKGPLQGRVHLHLRLFPLRSNPFDKEAGLALLAADRMGHFWDLTLQSYARFDTFSLEAQQGWAEALGLDMVEFRRLLEDPSLVTALSASKKEGLENGVEGTPTFFIDGRMYRGEAEVDEIVDALEEAWDRQAGRVYVGDAVGDEP